jgi:hypothetical protein
MYTRPGDHHHQNAHILYHVAHSERFFFLVFFYYFRFFGGRKCRTARFATICALNYLKNLFLKSGSAARIIGKSRKGDAYAHLGDANSTALPQSYPASIGSGCGILL